MLVVSETLWYGKKHMNKTGVNANIRQTIFVSFYRESALGTLRCFTKILVEGILHVWSRGISRFSVAIFLYQSLEIFHRELLIVSRRLWQRKVCKDERRGYHVFPSSFSCLTLPKNFIGNTSSFQKISGIENFLWMRGGGGRRNHVFPWKKISITVPESFIGNASWFENVSGIWRNKWSRRGYISNFCQNFGLILPKRFLGTLRGFKEILAAKNLCGWEWGISGFAVEILWITVPEKFIEKSPWFQKLSVMRINIWTRRGKCKFPSIIFCLLLPRNCIGNTPVFHKSSGSRNFAWMREGVITFFCRKFSVSEFRKFSLGSLRCFRKLLPAKLLRDATGDITFSRRFLSSHNTKISLGALQCFKKIPVAKNFYGCEGGYHVLRSILFRLMITKTFIGNFSVFKEICRSEKCVWMRERDITFCHRNFLNHSTWEIHWEIFVVSETLWYGKKIMNKTVVVQFSVKQFLSPFTEKVHCEHIGVSQKIW